MMWVLQFGTYKSKNDSDEILFFTGILFGSHAGLAKILSKKQFLNDGFLSQGHAGLFVGTENLVLTQNVLRMRGQKFQWQHVSKAPEGFVNKVNVLLELLCVYRKGIKLYCGDGHKRHAKSPLVSFLLVMLSDDVGLLEIYFWYWTVTVFIPNNHCH